MKKYILYIFLLSISLTACQNDDTDFSAYIHGESTTANVIYIVYNGTSVTVTGDNNGYVSTSGADVTVNTGTSTDSLLLVLSGSTSDGSLLVYREKKYGIRLNGVTIHNADGAAINNQCGKSLYVELVEGTTNTLTDGTSYTEQEYQQKGAFFSEGQLLFSGSGTLSVTGNTYHALVSDDYIVIDDDVQLNITSSTGHGIKVNEGFWMYGGSVTVNVSGDACKGIKNDSTTVITGGVLNVTTTGDCVYDDTEADYSSSACIKSGYQFLMSGGTVTLESSGDGGKGINCDQDVVLNGGTLTVTTTGSNDNSKPKGIKGDTGITIAGGSLKVTVNKSWACDNGSESDDPADHITVQGTPSSSSIEKKAVEIIF